MRKKLILFTIFIFATTLLSGCAGVENQTGFFYNTFVRPFSWLIYEIGTLFGGNFGLALVLITIMIRLALMPFMLKTYKNQQLMKVNMEKIKPEMEDIQKRTKEAQTPEEKQKIQQEMMALYQKHNINPLIMGCLPMIIQMPILMGVYWAIRSSEEIATHGFLWFDLGQSDIIMTFLAGLVYFVQVQVSLTTMTDAQKKQMRLLMYISPAMIIFISMSAPAALPLYWAVGGVFLIIQQLIGKKYYQNNAEKVEESSK